MKFVSCFGGVYKMPERTYKRFLKAVIAQETFDLDTEASLVGVLECDVTDLDTEEARERLKDLS